MFCWFVCFFQRVQHNSSNMFKRNDIDRLLELDNAAHFRRKPISVYKKICLGRAHVSILSNLDFALVSAGAIFNRRNQLSSFPKRFQRLCPKRTCKILYILAKRERIILKTGNYPRKNKSLKIYFYQIKTTKKPLKDSRHLKNKIKNSETIFFFYTGIISTEIETNTVR